MIPLILTSDRSLTGSGDMVGRFKRKGVSSVRILNDLLVDKTYLQWLNVRKTAKKARRVFHKSG